MRRIVGGLLVLWCLLFTGCSSQTATLTPTITPGGAPTPVIATGDYAFIRNGDIWVRRGLGAASKLTNLRLSDAHADWGQLVWSPDHATLTYVLRSANYAPGIVSPNAFQQTGTLFAIALNARQPTQLVAGQGKFTVPLQGRHLAWRDNQTLLFTSGGAIEQVSLGSDHAFTTIIGPTNVWEIVLRGSALWYSTIARLTTTGAGVAEVHRFDLVTQSDTLVATLGPAQEPPEPCDLVCPPDSATPYAPYAWDVSPDGKWFAYQTAHMPDASAVTPTPTSAASELGAFYLSATQNPTSPQHIFTDSATGTSQEALAFAPDNRRLALSLLDGGVVNAPAVYDLTSKTTQSLLSPAGAQLFTYGLPSWSPDSASFALDSVMVQPGSTQPGPATVDCANLNLNDGIGRMESDAVGCAWGA